MKDGPTRIRGDFRAGRLDKRQYSEEMHRFHALLFDYAELIRGTQVARIEIAAGQVCVVTREGLRFVCDPADRYLPPVQLLNFGDYEAGEREVFFRLVGPGQCVFDIGANIGWYSLLVAQRFPACRVFAFEPIPSSFRLLEQNIRINGCEHIRAFNFGLADHEGDEVFFFLPEISGAASGANLLGSEAAQKTICRVRRWDDVWRELGVPVDFVKCDVEGAELFVIRGGLECLTTDRPVVCCEMLRKWSAKFDYHPNEIIATLTSAGYECYAISGARLQRLVTMDDSTEPTNFVFLHRQRHVALRNELIAEQVLTP